MAPFTIFRKHLVVLLTIILPVSSTVPAIGAGGNFSSPTPSPRPMISPTNLTLPDIFSSHINFLINHPQTTLTLFAHGELILTPAMIPTKALEVQVNQTVMYLVVHPEQVSKHRAELIGIMGAENLERLESATKFLHEISHSEPTIQVSLQEIEEKLTSHPENLTGMVSQLQDLYHSQRALSGVSVEPVVESGAAADLKANEIFATRLERGIGGVLTRIKSLTSYVPPLSDLGIPQQVWDQYKDRKKILGGITEKQVESFAGALENPAGPRNLKAERDNSAHANSLREQILDLEKKYPALSLLYQKQSTDRKLLLSATLFAWLMNITFYPILRFFSANFLPNIHIPGSLMVPGVLGIVASVVAMIVLESRRIEIQSKIKPFIRETLEKSQIKPEGPAETHSPIPSPKSERGIFVPEIAVILTTVGTLLTASASLLEWIPAMMPILFITGLILLMTNLLRNRRQKKNTSTIPQVFRAGNHTLVAREGGIHLPLGGIIFKSILKDVGKVEITYSHEGLTFVGTEKGVYVFAPDPLTMEPQIEASFPGVRVKSFTVSDGVLQVNTNQGQYLWQGNQFHFIPRAQPFVSHI